MSNQSYDFELFTAIEEQNIDKVAKLIEEGVKVNDYLPTLVAAAMHYNEEIIELLLEAGVEARYNIKTILHYVLMKGKGDHFLATQHKIYEQQIAKRDAKT